MLRAEIYAIIAAALRRLVEAGELPEAVLEVEFDVQDTKSPEHGDFATNAAMVATKLAGIPPRVIGEKLAAAIANDERLETAEVAGPGFVNIRLKPSYVAAYAARVLELGESLALQAAQTRRVRTRRDAQKGATQHKINVEFVSVNPNGPITVGSGRGAAYGDTLCRVLAAAGHTVHREFYVNDGVNSEQMRLFAESVRYYVGLRIFGEWESSEDVVAWDEDLVKVINAFAGTNRGLLTEPAEHVYEAWLNWAKANSGERSISRSRSLMVLANDSKPYYRANRMRQLRSYLAEAWKSGKFVPPIFRFPEGGYRGDYVRETALKFVRYKAERAEEFFEEAEQHIFADDGLGWYQKKAQDWMIERQREGLKLFGVQFDTWFSEQSLHDSGAVAKRLKELSGKGAADEEPYRIKLKLGKGGQIEEVVREDQPVEDDEEEEVAVAAPHHQPPHDTNHSRRAGSPGTTLWLRSTKFGDDMDRVLRRRDGRLTYIASDVAYHADKFNRPPGADKLITILGPDHHGYIGRLHAVVAALLEDVGSSPLPLREAEGEGGGGGGLGDGLTPEEALIFRSPQERDECRRALNEARKRLEVIIFQIVRFMKDGKPAPMRKRDGNIYELRDLIRELGKAQAPNARLEEQERIGADVARYFYLMRSHDTHMDFDIDLATKQSDENPVFYVQYAHARICSVLRKAEEAGFSSPGLVPSKTNLHPQPLPSPLRARGGGLDLITHQRELALIKKIVDLPDEVRRAADDYGVHRLTTYSVELARAFHYFYDACRIIQPDQPDLSHARLILAKAAQIGLKSTLELLGVSAPDRMERSDQ